MTIIDISLIYSSFLDLSSYPILSPIYSFSSLSDKERQARDLNPKKYDPLSPRQRQQFIIGLRHELGP